MQRLQGRQEAVAQHGDGTGREGDAAAAEPLANLLALEMAVVAGQPDLHDQVVAEACPGGASPASCRETATGAGRHRRQHLRIFASVASSAAGRSGGPTKSTMGRPPAASVARAIRAPSQRACSAGRRAPLTREEVVASEHGLHLRQPDGRGAALQAAGHGPGRGAGMADQHEQHGDDHAGVQRAGRAGGAAGGEELAAGLQLAVARPVGGGIDIGARGGRGPGGRQRAGSQSPRKESWRRGSR